MWSLSLRLCNVFTPHEVVYPPSLQHPNSGRSMEHKSPVRVKSLSGWKPGMCCRKAASGYGGENEKIAFPFPKSAHRAWFLCHSPGCFGKSYR
ncbi:hypothetical protein CPSG_01001 [Coccidioides posadasii str. Silveira]|uniref:Uncharacterized protein n=1 Tax=Coccidioides posadasii (strain RMSCC 757 / Silveira) TaxID=443226 RepID=E9CUC0_COCPS|nr:hypothetical protein CPSG_01001 [Coccidioides posadasii str. Silveira]